MMYSSNRELKEKLWKAYNTRAFGGEFDNSKIVEEIADTACSATILTPTMCSKNGWPKAPRRSTLS